MRQHLVETKSSVLAGALEVGEPSDEYAGEMSQSSTQSQMSKHAVDPV